MTNLGIFASDMLGQMAADVVEKGTACVLHIETSTPLCSVALSLGAKFLYTTDYNDKPENHHAEHVGPMVDRAMQIAKQEGLTLDAVAVSAGPGSYTGLRIGASVAKGLAFGLQIPLVAIPSTEILVATAQHFHPECFVAESLTVCPVIDARRMEVYTCICTREGKSLTDAMAVIVNADSFSDILSLGPVLFVGDGSDKCHSILTHPNARFLPRIIYPWAGAMADLALARIEHMTYADVAYWEPHYLKEFVAIVSKNKVLNQLNQ